MKPKYTLAILMLFACLSIFGQQLKNVSMQGATQHATVQTATNQQESIKQLQTENESMKAQLEKMEKEIELYRGDVRTKMSELDAEQSRWTAWMCLFVTIVTAGLGVGLPIFINNRNDKRLKDSYEKIVGELKEKVSSVEADAKSAKESLSEVTELKKDIEAIKKDIDNSKKDAERAAKRAMVSKLFAQAVSEKDLAKAIELYSKAIELDSNFAEAYNNRGYAKSLLGEEEEALQDYNKAIELNPILSEAYNNRGNTKENLDDYNGALEDFDKAIELNPDYAKAYNNRGIVKRELKDTTGAMIDFNKAIEFRGNFPEAYCNRGLLKEMIGDNDGALLDYNIAKNLNPLFYGSYKCIGVFERKTGKLVQAISNLSRAIALNATDDELYSERAKCYRQLVLDEQNSLKKGRFIAKAEADEQKAESLKEGSKK